jgi:hypothetical protein
MSNSGIGRTANPQLAAEAQRARNLAALDRRERFAKEHPEISIRAKREQGGRLVFYVSARDYEIAWLDATAMMDYLENM